VHHFQVTGTPLAPALAPAAAVAAVPLSLVPQQPLPHHQWLLLLLLQAGSCKIPVSLADTSENLKNEENKKKGDKGEKTEFTLRLMAEAVDMKDTPHPQIQSAVSNRFDVSVRRGGGGGGH